MNIIMDVRGTMQDEGSFVIRAIITEMKVEDAKDCVITNHVFHVTMNGVAMSDLKKECHKVRRWS